MDNANDLQALSSENPFHTVEFAGFVGSFFERNVTKFAPRKAIKLIV